jgi:hypothetical protein
MVSSLEYSVFKENHKIKFVTLCLYLVSSWITGAVIDIDGGVMTGRS